MVHGLVKIDQFAFVRLYLIWSPSNNQGDRTEGTQMIRLHAIISFLNLSCYKTNMKIYYVSRSCTEQLICSCY